MGLLEERDSELARIEELLDRVTPDGGRLLALVGPTGIGKTTLLAAALERARARELQILRARAGELGREFAFGVVRQLFEPTLATRPDPEALFAGAAALARPLFTVADGSPDPLVGERAHGSSASGTLRTHGTEDNGYFTSCDTGTVSWTASR